MRGRGGVRKWVWGRRWHWERERHWEIGRWKKEGHQEMRQSWDTIALIWKTKKRLSIFEMRTKYKCFNENWRRKTNNYVSEEGRLSSLRNAAQQCSEVLTRRCHNIPKDGQIIREPLLISNWSVVMEENKWWCRRRMLPSYAYLPDHLMSQKWGKCSGISNALLFAWIEPINWKKS